DLLPALIEWRKGKTGNTFFTEATINLADDEALMDMMTTAGFNMVFIGIETPDEECLTECSKVQNKNRDLVEDVKRLQRAGLQVQAGFIVGFDHDGPSIFQRQIDFIQKSGIVTAMVGLLQAPPGTRLFERMKEAGRIRGESSGDNVDGTTNIVPAMGFDALVEGYKGILEHIYAPQHYYERVKTFLREYRPSGVRGHLRFSHYLALVRSVFRLGIFGSERRHYWKLLLWTQFRRPRLIPEAVVFSIIGYHFLKVCELHVLREETPPDRWAAAETS
ncbi:B12-binding domain-containing radical SAM protein, partial [Verrucomicrobiota bacterium]